MQKALQPLHSGLRQCISEAFKIEIAPGNIAILDLWLAITIPQLRQFGNSSQLKYHQSYLHNVEATSFEQEASALQVIPATKC